MFTSSAYVCKYLRGYCFGLGVAQFKHILIIFLMLNLLVITTLSYLLNVVLNMTMCLILFIFSYLLFESAQYALIVVYYSIFHHLFVLLICLAPQAYCCFHVFVQCKSVYMAIILVLVLPTSNMYFLLFLC